MVPVKCEAKKHRIEISILISYLKKNNSLL